MIEQILPAAVVAAELFGDVPAELFPAEEAAIAQAVGKRRREFTSVRVCARRALAALGQPPAPLVPGGRGAPRWPDGITGSMTHCDGYRGCVVARTADLASVGLDAEPNDVLPDRVERVVMLPAERAHIAALAAAAPGVCWDRLLFSAKEAVYKAWYPVTGRWLGFEQASIEFAVGGDGAGGDGEAAQGTFTARLLVPAPVPAFTGRWLCSGAHLLALVLNEDTA
ncbi:MAG TPA: 4'-phosphopantetheinyl transferase superfamily protein [Streptosporangiaceae bacterium]|jgi:4'-phosphopantetheinyl transferase EntD